MIMIIDLNCAIFRLYPAIQIHISFTIQNVAFSCDADEKCYHRRYLFISFNGKAKRIRLCDRRLGSVQTDDLTKDK